MLFALQRRFASPLLTFAYQRSKFTWNHTRNVLLNHVVCLERTLTLPKMRISKQMVAAVAVIIFLSVLVARVVNLISYEQGYSAKGDGKETLRNRQRPLNSTDNILWFLQVNNSCVYRVYITFLFAMEQYSIHKITCTCYSKCA